MNIRAHISTAHRPPHHSHTRDQTPKIQIHIMYKSKTTEPQNHLQQLQQHVTQTQPIVRTHPS